MRQFTVQHSVTIQAPTERCFLLSTSLDIVRAELGMQISPSESNRRDGHIEASGDQLVWRGWKFGLPQMHETLITGFDPPRSFQDTMGRGRFRTFQHDHHLTAVRTDDGREATRLDDELRFTMPFGWAGALVGRWVMVPHIRKLLRRRFVLLKRLAEGEEWREYVAA